LKTAGVTMTRQRRTKIPNPEVIVHYLEREADPEVRIRLVLLNLIGKLDGHFALADICDLLKVPLSTAYVWIRSWKNSGYQGILNPCQTTKGPTGRPPTLNDADLGQLKVLLSGKDRWTTQEARELIASTWGVTLSASQVQRILRRKLHMHLSKPYPHDYRRPSDAEKQLELALGDAYKSLINKGLSADKIALGFMDEASPQTTSNTVRLWHFGHPGIVKNTTRYKANTIGFYAIKGQSVDGFLQDSTQESIQSFLGKVRVANRD
jgi:transposase